MSISMPLNSSFCHFTSTETVPISKLLVDAVCNSALAYSATPDVS